MARRALVEKNLATLRTKLQTAKMKYLTEVKFPARITTM